MLKKVFPILGVILCLSFCLSSNLYAQANDNPRILSKKLNKQLDILLEEFVSTSDSIKMYQLVSTIITIGLACDSCENVSQKHNNLKPLYREKNKPLLQVMRRMLVDAGLYYYRNGMNQQSLSSFSQYIATAKNPLFVKESIDNDPYLFETMYYAALVSYEEGDYNTTKQYAKLLLDDDHYAKKAAELKLLCLKSEIKTERDSLEYCRVLTKMHEAEPQDKNYFSMLVEYYTSSSQHEKFAEFLRHEIEFNKENFEAYVLLGDELMKQQMWNEAIKHYTTALSLSENYSLEAPIYYNIGLCYNAQAIEERKVIEQLNKSLNKKQRGRINELLNSAVTYLDQARELDPNREIVDWAKPMYQSYHMMRNKNKCEELLPLINK